MAHARFAHVVVVAALVFPLSGAIAEIAPAPDTAVVAVDTATCRHQGEPVPVPYRSNQLLVAPSALGTVEAALEAVSLGNVILDVVGTTPDRLVSLVQIVGLPPLFSLPNFVQTYILSDTFIADLNYVHALAPPWRFKPGDDPAPAATNPGGPGGPGGTVEVVVFDSGMPAPGFSLPPVTFTSDPMVESYDLDANGQVDPVAGHGPFAAALIDRMHPAPAVHLVRVPSIPSLDPSQRPYIDQFSLIATMYQAFDFDVASSRFTRPVDVVNLSLGGPGCPGLRHGALRAAFRFMLDANSWANGIPPLMVAAAGNSGRDVPHYPAAFATQTLTRPGRQDPVAGRVVSVGALDGPGGAPTAWSNYGSWVHAWAPGQQLISIYPLEASPSGWASWSGTSFATAYMSSVLAETIAQRGLPPATVWCDAATGAGTLVDPAIRVTGHPPGC